MERVDMFKDPKDGWCSRSVVSTMQVAGNLTLRGRQGQAEKPELCRKKALEGFRK